MNRFRLTTPGISFTLFLSVANIALLMVCSATFYKALKLTSERVELLTENSLQNTKHVAELTEIVRASNRLWLHANKIFSIYDTIKKEPIGAVQWSYASQNKTVRTFKRVRGYTDSRPRISCRMPNNWNQENNGY